MLGSGSITQSHHRLVPSRLNSLEGTCPVEPSAFPFYPDSLPQHRFVSSQEYSSGLTFLFRSLYVLGSHSELCGRAVCLSTGRLPDSILFRQ